MNRYYKETAQVKQRTRLIPKPLASFFGHVRCIGYHDQIDEYEKRKLGVFNQLNFIGIICGILVSTGGLFDRQALPWIASLVAFSPVLISSVVLWLNYKKKYELSRIVYFSCYPIVTTLVYAVGMDVGVELFFILYGVLGVFYMQRPLNAALAFLLSISCYLIVFVFSDGYSYQLRNALYPFYVVNHFVAIIFIFFALFWIKKENKNFQQGMIQKNNDLQRTNLEVEKQREEIAKKAEQLAELNNLKSKLFSVISHDLKNPIYALRNLFRNVKQYDLPAEELKLMVPDIINDLNYTTSLMENLLQWAKSQMDANDLQLTTVNLSQLTEDIVGLLRLQASTKKIYLENKMSEPVYVFADKEMLNLVLRNLISNAIKFTPNEGKIIVQACDIDEDIEVSVKDTGIGMNDEALKKISGNNFYSTNGTANETGTGLGLILCKEFLQKIGSRMFIESEYGKGSTFSFTLPRVAEEIA